MCVCLWERDRETNRDRERDRDREKEREKDRKCAEGRDGRALWFKFCSTITAKFVAQKILWI